MDRLRDILRQALPQLAKLLAIPSPATPANEARPKAETLIAGIASALEKARRQAELMSLESNEPRLRESISSGDLEAMLSGAERMSALATWLASDSGWQEWQQMPPEAQAAESELRNAIARRIEHAAPHEDARDADANLSQAFARWTETIQQLSLEGGRISRISQMTAEARHLG